MSWLKVDDQMTWHKKFLAAKNDGTGAWVRMAAHACAQLTDGFVDEDVAMAIAKSKALIERLVKVRLLDRSPGGYMIHDFHDWNPRASEVKARREVDRQRKAAGRGNQGRGSDGRVTSGRPDDEREDVSSPSAQPSAQPSARTSDGTSARTPHGTPPVPSPSPSLSETNQIPATISQDHRDGSSLSTRAKPVRDPARQPTRLRPDPSSLFRPVVAGVRR